MITAAVISSLAASSLLGALEADGYENLRIASGPVAQIRYENRVRFLEIDAMGAVLRHVSRHLEVSAVELVPLRHGIPLVEVVVPLDAYRAFERGDLDAEGFGDRLQVRWPDEPAAFGGNPSQGRVDLQVGPGYRFTGVAFQAFLNGTLSSTLAPGLAAVGRSQAYLAPPDLGVDVLQLRGLGWLRPGLLGSWMAGRWGSDRYGAFGELGGGEGEWFWRASGGWASGIHPIAFAQVERRFHPLDLVIAAGAGWFAEGDRAVYGKLVRWFPRSAVELGLYQSDLGVQLRVGLGINLGPEPLPEPAPFRVWAPGWFGAEYRASSPPAARLLFPWPDSDESLRRLTPAYVRAHVERWRNEQAF